MSLLHDIATKITAAIKRVVAERRVEQREPEEPVSESPLFEEEIVAALDAAARAEGLDWRRSIVDLQKTLGLPSDFEYRAALAIEMDILDYTGTAEQNELLHKLVMDEVRRGGLPIPQ